MSMKRYYGCWRHALVVPEREGDFIQGETIGMKRRKVTEGMAVFFLLAVIGASPAGAWSGLVVAVPAGDMVKVSRSGDDIVEVRLFGIDAPEKDQPFGPEARQFLARLLDDGVVEVKEVGFQDGNSPMAFVVHDGVILNPVLIQQGYAWVDWHTCDKTICANWVEYEEKARDASLGLWQDHYAIPPWEWRIDHQ
jgi:endonuclease YncB( thermonuclease family)